MRRPDPDPEFLALYLTRFAGGFGIVALATLLPTYVDLFDPSAFVLGMFTTGFTIAQTAAVVPLAWWGDAGDKRTVLLTAVGLGIVAYAGLAAVSPDTLALPGPVAALLVTGWGFVAARAVQGVAATGGGLMSLAMVGELSPPGERANHIGKANAARFAAGILGALSSGALYDAFGFGAVYGLLVALFVAAGLGLLLFVPRDETRIGGFPFATMALNRRLLTLTTFRAQYAVAVTLVRTWVPIFAGVAAAKGGLAYGALAVGVVVTAEKTANMLCQPFTGRLSDGYGRAAFVAVGGAGYGLVALAVPFTPTVGEALGIVSRYPFLGPLSPAFLPLVALNALLGVADAFREPASMALFADEGADSDDGGVASSFGVRELVWRPGSVAAPLLGGYLMTDVGMGWVFYVGGGFALSAVAAFVAVLVASNGRRALTSW